jgi:deoxycytidine triphosphate deaminase
MIAEVEAAILDADAIIRECRARVVDPAVVDPGARGRAEDSEVVAHRLHNALVHPSGIAGLIFWLVGCAINQSINIPTFFS